MSATGRLVNSMLGLLLCAGACGTAVSCGGTTAENDDLITGDWVVEELAVDRSSAPDWLDLSDRSVVVALSSAKSSLVADTGCHRLFGSFTFLPDGVSSFTVPGSTTQTCTAEDLAVEDALVAALESISSWEQRGDSLVFSGLNSLLVLRPL